MKDEYDFIRAEKNPCVRKAFRQITLSLDAETMEFFEAQAISNGLSCETTICRYLADCAAKKHRLSWT